MVTRFRFINYFLPNVSVMDRYIFIQLLLPFLFGVGAFSSIATSVGSVFELIRQVTQSGLPIEIAAKVLALTMPEFIGYSFPMSVLLATMMTFGRLSGDSEIIAMRSAGISIYRLIVPALVLSLMVTGMTFVLQESVVPAAKLEAATTMERAIKQGKPSFQKDNIIYPEFNEEKQPDGSKVRKLVRIFYARQFNGQEMTDIIVIDRSQSEISTVVNAKSGRLDIGKKKWSLSNATTYSIDPKSEGTKKVYLERGELDMGKTPLEIAALERQPDQMNVTESISYLEVLKAKGDWKAVNTFQIRIQQKLALPFVCLIFGIIGSAVGIRPQRGGKATSFGVSLLMIFGYYILITVMGALGEVGYLSPFLAGWIPNMLGVGVGVYLLTKTAR
jgi:lipopolysaccharide export system permease protein